MFLFFFVSQFPDLEVHLHEKRLRRLSTAPPSLPVALAQQPCDILKPTAPTAQTQAAFAALAPAPAAPTALVTAAAQPIGIPCPDRKSLDVGIQTDLTLVTASKSFVSCLKMAIQVALLFLPCGELMIDIIGI